MKITSISKLNAKTAIAVAAAGALISIAFIKSNPAATAALQQKKKVERPLKEADVAYTSYMVSAEAASVLTYTTGSGIKIPARAFVDDKGKAVTGTVELRYREFHDPADFFISGIPMTYDSAGTEYHFESAGMLEILAFQEGKPVFVNHDKRIVVEMVSMQPADKYNIYRFDSLAGNWKFVYKDRAGAKEQAGNVAQEMPGNLPASPVTALLMKEEYPPEPLKPQLADKNNYRFNIAADSSEFPEMAIYKGLEFEVKEGEKDFDKTYASRVWTDVSLERNNKGSYLVTLTGGKESHRFEVNPVFDEAAFKDAYKTYSGLLKVRKLREAKVKRSNDSLLFRNEQERVFQSEYNRNFQKLQAARYQNEDFVKRVFIVSGFGIWNSDCPASLPKGELFAAKYVDSTGKRINVHTIYLVEKGRNAMFSLYDPSHLQFNPAKKNTLWTITDDNKLAMMAEEHFKFLKRKNDSCTVVLKIIDRHITQAQEVKDLLKL